MTRMVQVAAIVAGIIIGVSSPAIRAQGLNGLGGMTDGTHQFKPYRRIHLGPEYRDTIIEAEVPVVKVLCFNELLIPHTLQGESEYLVIGGDYRVKASYY
ncbi:MAG: hypothetical protein B7Z70_15230 [Acidithiobacillus ferrivorans]|uniref:Uncharacterized protein n=1 Tax=Acidithiobacillus ferrivorans TaxID=160808 RepID=A0A257SGB5_9PROT|nr:MAG: hypothetical protein B7Z70_15230 [Acidithiobacillus ferrivorans]